MIHSNLTDIEVVCNRTTKLMRKAALKLLCIVLIIMAIPLFATSILYKRIFLLFITMFFIIFACLWIAISKKEQLKIQNYSIMLRNIEQLISFFRTHSLPIERNIFTSTFVKRRVVICATLFEVHDKSEYKKAAKRTNKYLSKSKGMCHIVRIYNNQIQLNLIVTDIVHGDEMNNSIQLLTRARPLIKIQINTPQDKLIIPAADNSLDWGELKKYYAVLLLIKEAITEMNT